ncbi:MAG: hypothetical protein WBA88_21175 [Pseudaminobacter sp.]
MTATISKSVTLTKMCELHGIGLPREGALAEQFQKAFASAVYDDAAGEWRMVWKKGTYADSNARLEAFFAENGIPVSHVDKC